MPIVNAFSFFQGVNALSSLARQQPKDTASLFPKILTVRNSVHNLNKSQNIHKDIHVNTGLTGKREAPPRPAQPSMSSLLNLAMVDFEKNRELAKAKWEPPKGIPEQHSELTGEREVTLTAKQLKLASILKMNMGYFKQDS